jgi:hypothetical protein
MEDKSPLHRSRSDSAFFQWKEDVPDDHFPLQRKHSTLFEDFEIPHNQNIEDKVIKEVIQEIDQHMQQLPCRPSNLIQKIREDRHATMMEQGTDLSGTKIKSHDENCFAQFIRLLCKACAH